MKLLRFGEIGREKPGLLDKDGHVRDLSAQVKDITGDILSPDGLKRLAAINASELPRVPSGVRMGAPVAGINKLVAIGLNYADHAAEAGMQLPTEPIFFMKALTSICGPDDNVEKPRGSTKLDWEVELGFVIGTTAKYVERSRRHEPCRRLLHRQRRLRARISRSSAAAPGPRASRSTPSARSGRGW